MAHPTGTQPPEPAAHSRPHRNDRGLTTLEWLLIVAAVAGLAALAVVLVQNVVDETAEQISGNNARLTAAQVAAQEITDDAKTANDVIDNAEGKAKCERLKITYGDALTKEGKIVVWNKTKGDKTGNGDGADDAHDEFCEILDKA